MKSNEIRTLFDKEKESCRNAGGKISDHFADVSKVIEAGKGVQKNNDLIRGKI